MDDQATEQAKDEAKARRALVILYSIMITFGILPFVLYWLFLRN